MIRFVGFTLFLSALACAAAQAQQGTLDQDYFSPRQDNGYIEYRNSIDTAHAKPALAAFARGDMRATQVDLEYVLRRTINHPQMLALAGLFSITTKRPRWAMPYFERALSIYPEYALTHAQFGKYLTDIGMVDDGIGRLKKAIEIDPKLVAGYVWLAAAYKKHGQADLAREAEGRARSLGYSGKFSTEGANP